MNTIEADGRYRSLFDSVPMGLYRATPAGALLDANVSLVKMLGYPDRESLLQLNIGELCANGAEREGWWALLRKGATGEACEVQFRRYDGTLIWVEHTVRLGHEAQGSAVECEGAVKDVTARRRTEEALRESEERFRTIVEQSPISVQVLTPDGWTVQVNKAWERLWGVTAGDLRHYNMLHDEQAQSLGMMPYVERGFHGETVVMPPVSYDTPETVGTGRKRWFQARIYPVKSGDEIRNVIMMYEDITERQWATEDLRRLSAQLLSAQEAERRQISQDLHDDVGQALTAMRINLDTLARELPPEVAPQVRGRLLETRALVDHVLDHVREVAHSLRPTMLDELGLVPTLRSYVVGFGRRLGIEATFEAHEIEERLPPEVETVIYRIVQEALTNSARHAGARHVWVRIERNDARAVAIVEDDGVGFDVRKRMAAEPQQRGVGLVGMRERAALLGGTLEIRSRKGKGTKLTVKLPVSV